MIHNTTAWKEHKFCIIMKSKANNEPNVLVKLFEEFVESFEIGELESGGPNCRASSSGQVLSAHTRETIFLLEFAFCSAPEWRKTKPFVCACVQAAKLAAASAAPLLQKMSRFLRSLVHAQRSPASSSCV